MMWLLGILFRWHACCQRACWSVSQ